MGPTFAGKKRPLTAGGAVPNHRNSPRMPFTSPPVTTPLPLCPVPWGASAPVHAPGPRKQVRHVSPGPERESPAAGTGRPLVTRAVASFKLHDFD